MQNFYYNIPTKIYFGKGQIEQLGKNLKDITDHVLLAYGGGSIKNNGLYDKVIEQLKNADIQWEELSGIETKPGIESVRRGVAICNNHGVGAVPAVGGGSTTDSATLLASGLCLGVVQGGKVM